MTTPTEELIIVKKPKKPATKKDKTQLYLVLKGEYLMEFLPEQRRRNTGSLPIITLAGWELLRMEFLWDVGSTKQ